MPEARSARPGPRRPGARAERAAGSPDLAAALAAAPLPTVLTTADARVLLANRAMQRLVGVPVDGIVGRFLAEFAGPPHGRLRRLATVAVSAQHPVTADVRFSLGRRRTIAVRVVVARGAAPAGEPFLVWQVTSAPNAHALADAPARSAPETVAAQRVEGTGPRADARGVALEMVRTPPDRPVDEVAERLAALAADVFGRRPLRLALDAAGPVPVSASTDPVAALAVQVEAELGGVGPVSGTADGAPVVVSDLAADERWTGVGAEISRRLGVMSVLAAPLRRGNAVVGSLAVYGDAPGAFDDADVSLADWVAAVAGGVLVAAVRCRSAATEVEQLRTAMASRAVIEQAKGILMARHLVDEGAAFAMLRARSQGENRRLRDIATAVVRAATCGDGAGAPSPHPSPRPGA